MKHMQDQLMKFTILELIIHGTRCFMTKRIKSIPIYITEGEKKALKGTQEGLPCIAISGLWNWGRKTENGYELLPDFDQIALEDRMVYLVPDSDWLEPNPEGKTKKLEQALNELAYCLIDKGAK